MQEIEMNDKMLERRDQIDNATYHLFQELLDVTDEEAEKIYPWDIAPQTSKGIAGVTSLAVSDARRILPT